MKKVIVPSSSQSAFRGRRIQGPEHCTMDSMPPYLTRPKSLEMSVGKMMGCKIVHGLLRCFVWFALRPRRNRVGNLSPEEVKRVYDKEAITYDFKHHLTTHGMDTIWRRAAGWCVANYIRRKQSLSNRDHITVLDVCTGTGLTVLEICRVLAQWNLSAKIIGIDCNEKMLERAKRRTYPSNCEVSFFLGDASALVLGEQSEFLGTEAKQFHRSSIDVVTQVFGLGGIGDPLASLTSILKVLKAEGEFFLIDIHRPLVELPGEWFCGKWWAMPYFEATTFYEVTVPLVLKRLWGWKDSTPYFYLCEKVSEEYCCSQGEDSEKAGEQFGFETVYLEVESQRWWFGLPLMPVAKAIYRKVKLK
jgi:ubiquinone/menaquinone biosynthesis C-methylase UbiE